MVVDGYDGEIVNWDSAKWWTDQANFYCGCRKVSPACENCYAKSIVGRFKMNGDEGFSPTKHDKVKMPKSGIVFVGNLTDAFGEWVDNEEIFKWFNSMYHKNEGTGNNYRNGWMVPNEASYIWLTKRVARMMSMLRYAIADNENAYYGFTAENQEWYDKRISELFPNGKDVYAFEYPYKHWVSCEPLLGPIDLHLDMGVFLYGRNTRSSISSLIRQVIVGCESGHNRRHCEISWIEDIVKQCRKANVPVFVKQIELEDGRFTKDISEFPKQLQVRQLAWAR